MDLDSHLSVSDRCMLQVQILDQGSLKLEFLGQASFGILTCIILLSESDRRWFKSRFKKVPRLCLPAVCLQE